MEANEFKKTLQNLNIFCKNTFEIQQNIKTDEVVGVAYYSSWLFLNNDSNVVIVSQNLYIAQQIRDLLYSILNKDDIIYIPSEELVAVEYVATSKEIESDRIYGLYKLATSNSKKIIILNLAAYLRIYPKKELLLNSIINLKVGDEIDYYKLRNKFLEIGYSFANKIEKTGDVCFRGSIIDIFPLNYDQPVRIDLFDNEIEKIKFFDIESQLSQKEIPSLSIIPNTDILLDEKNNLELQDILKNKLNNEIKNCNDKARLEDNIKEVINNLKENNIDIKLYKYFCLVNEKSNILSYFNKNDYIIYTNSEQIEVSKEKLLLDSSKFLNELVKNSESLNDLYLFYSDLNDNNFYKIKNYDFYDVDFYSINIERPLLRAVDKNTVYVYLKNLYEQNYKIILVFDYKQQKDFFISTYADNENCLEILNNSSFAVDFLNIGAIFKDLKIAIITTNELFNYRSNGSRFLSRFKASTVLKSFNDLNIGDYVVHEKYGISKYDGIKTITSQGITTDCLRLIFADDDALYIPVEQFKLIRKYVSKEGYEPKLSNLFSNKWELTKRKVKEKVSELAIDLMNLYSTRLNIKRPPYPEDDFFQEQFEKQVPFVLTKDQVKAIKDIKSDMAKDVPMNRLICGDVGFGKTEVAFVAAFKVINAGKQVLLLAPTTLLARQHFERAQIRFHDFDVRITLLTRFTKGKEFSNAVEDIKNGVTHFVIGTHKSLSKKIEFKDLGLIIIDEEQRFGVEQKEQLKVKNEAVDVITLSATPIPRTLQLSLSGLRSLSLINTAPINRAPIQTFLIKYNEKFVYEVIERELGRGGQTYYLYNDIFSMYTRVEKLEKNLPGARIASIHSKMDKKEIEDVMDLFYQGKIDVLVSTTIIENGIDVSNANLLIVENADRFGLAQLYQIKGRVGRGDKLAYAYLMYNEYKDITEEGRKRLKTIKEFTEFGSGYKVAQRDLLIRGAGDLLGKNQSGNINDVGIDLYLKLLNQAIKKVENKEDEISEENSEKIDSLKIDVNGYIPDAYAENSNKIEIYDLIDSSNTKEELKQAVNKIKDIYGAIPEESVNLIKIRELKIKLKEKVFDSYKETLDVIFILLNDDFSNIDGIGYKLFSILIGFKNNIKISYEKGKIKILLFKKSESWFALLNDLVDRILKLYNNEYEIR